MASDGSEALPEWLDAGDEPSAGSDATTAGDPDAPGSVEDDAAPGPGVDDTAE